MIVAAWKSTTGFVSKHQPIGGLLIKRTKHTWFISYKNERIESSDHSRLTETFANEFDAKSFARSKIRGTKDIYAGTINPHHPKQTILPKQIIDWLSEG
jgi:O-acetylhomoserine/O-acetylserine sulfhydrylase-like pyridoxal-dependent enzyme